MENRFLDASIKYRDKFDFSIIPVKPDKKPFITWKKFQKRRPTKEEITTWGTEYTKAMIGIVTGSLSGLLVIDCDTQAGYEAVQRLLPDTLIVPIARTPRGGWHLYFVFPNDRKLTIGAGIIPGVDFRGEGGFVVAPPSINGDGKGYTWEPGLSLDEVAPARLPDALYNKLNEFIYRSDGDRPQQTTTGHKDHKFFRQGRRDEDIFSLSNSLVKGGCDLPLAKEALKIIAQNCDPPFPQEEIEVKIFSALKRAERRDRNITAEIREWVETTHGHFLTTDCHKELHLTTKDDMKAANMALLRLCEGSGAIIEKHGDKRGCYRRIDRSIEFMEFENADIDNTVDLILPLGLHSKTKIFPKGVIVIAGVSGMGKTLFAFNTIAENMKRFPTFYFNSEMGPEALKQKLSHFPIPITEWAKYMKVIDQWDFSSIADKIQPDAFNVVDYLEPEGDKAFNIHGVISAIIRSLKKGTALITIQKKPDSRMGTGGIYSIKAATLALALDWGRIEIVKNRFCEADPMPSAMKINFDVHQGHKFVKVGDWYK